MSKTLEGVKPGDVIFVGSRGDYTTRQIVDKVGKIHVVCGTTKYRIDSGARAGDSGWYRTYARKATEELYEKERIRELNYLASKAWDKFREEPKTVKRLEEVLKVLDPKWEGK